MNWPCQAELLQSSQTASVPVGVHPVNCALVKVSFPRARHIQPSVAPCTRSDKHVRSTQGVNGLQQGLQIPVVWTSTFLNLPYVQEQACRQQVGLSVKCILGGQTLKACAIRSVVSTMSWPPYASCTVAITALTCSRWVAAMASSLLPEIKLNWKSLQQTPEQSSVNK